MTTPPPTNDVPLTDGPVALLGVVGLGRVGGALADLLDATPSMSTAVVRIDQGDDIATLATCDVVIEAIPENLAAKRSVLAMIQASAPDAIVLSTTSSFTIAEIATHSTRPDLVGGWHPFTPLHRRPLVEVAINPVMSPWVIAAAHALAHLIGHATEEVADSAGFVANRILKRWTHAALFAIDRGTDPAAIDATFRADGFRVGPVDVVRLVGAPTSLAVSRSFERNFGDRFTPPPLLISAASDPDLLTALAWRPGDEHEVDRQTPERSTVHDQMWAEVIDEYRRVIDEGIADGGAPAVDRILTVGLGWPAAAVATLTRS